MTLDDLLRRFVLLADTTEPARTIRGTALAVAQDWLVRLPAGPATDQAIDCLGQAADRACEALTNA